MDKTFEALIENFEAKFEKREDKIFYVNEGYEVDFSYVTEETVQELVKEGNIDAASDLDKALALIEEEEKNNFFKKKEDSGSDKGEKSEKSDKEDADKDSDDSKAAKAKEAGKKKDEVDVKEDVNTPEFEGASEALSEKIRDSLIAENLWIVAEETEEVIAKRKSIVDRLISEEKFELGERDFAVEFFAESFEDSSEIGSITGGDLVIESFKLENGSDMVRIKYNADKAALVEGFLKEGSANLDLHMVDAQTNKSLVSILGESFAKEDMDATLNLFNLAVESRVKVVKEDLESTVQDRVRVAVDAAVRAIDEMAEEVIAEWVNENRPTIVDSVKMKNMQGLVESVKTVFESYGLDIIESDSKIVQGLVEENAGFKSRETALAEELASLKAELGMLRGEKVIEDLSEGMSLSQKEKFKSMMEGSEFDEGYGEKAKLVAEKFFGKSSKADPKKALLEGGADDVLSESVVKQTEPQKDRYAEFLRRMKR